MVSLNGNVALGVGLIWIDPIDVQFTVNPDADAAADSLGFQLEPSVRRYGARSDLNRRLGYAVERAGLVRVSVRAVDLSFIARPKARSLG